MIFCFTIQYCNNFKKNTDVSFAKYNFRKLLSYLVIESLLVIH